MTTDGDAKVKWVRYQFYTEDPPDFRIQRLGSVGATVRLCSILGMY